MSNFISNIVNKISVANHSAERSCMDGSITSVNLTPDSSRYRGLVPSQVLTIV